MMRNQPPWVASEEERLIPERPIGPTQAQRCFAYSRINWVARIPRQLRTVQHIVHTISTFATAGPHTTPDVYYVHRNETYVLLATATLLEGLVVISVDFL
jgi:hypothetical protein